MFFGFGIFARAKTPPRPKNDIDTSYWKKDREYSDKTIKNRGVPQTVSFKAEYLKKIFGVTTLVSVTSYGSG
jgi:hypothetical protein